MKPNIIAHKTVLGTAQFGMDYGIANLSGQPTKKEVFKILTLCWENGVRRFDTAPNYGSENILGEFIYANGLQGESLVMTKIPSLVEHSDYEKFIKVNIESSIKNLGCSIDTLFFHNPADSDLILREPKLFENLLQDYPISTLGVSVYDTDEVEYLLDAPFELAFQFPFNVLDRRFKKINMTKGKRYARSIFLQGILASPNSLRNKAHSELVDLQKEYHEKLKKLYLDPICASISYVVHDNTIDYFIIGVDSVRHLQDILNMELYKKKEMPTFNQLIIKTKKKWLDPRQWN